MAVREGEVVEEVFHGGDGIDLDFFGRFGGDDDGGDEALEVVEGFEVGEEVADVGGADVDDDVLFEGGFDDGFEDFAGFVGGELDGFALVVSGVDIFDGEEFDVKEVGAE